MASTDPDILETPRGSKYRRLFVKALQPTTPETPAMTLTQNSRVTLGVVGAILVVGIGATWTLATVVINQFSSIRSEIRDLTSGLEAVKVDRYTLAAASETALRTAIENPGLRVPDPRNPGKVFVVDIARKTSGTP